MQTYMHVNVRVCVKVHGYQITILTIIASTVCYIVECMTNGVSNTYIDGHRYKSQP